MGPSPTHKLIPIRSELLQPGMYVAELDRSWLHSPFAGTGFLITAAGQVEQLRQLCRYVYVDPALSESPLAGQPAGADTPVATRPAREPGPVPPVASARRVLGASLHTVADIVHGARHQGIVDLAAVSDCVSQLVDQVLHGAAALHWFLRTDDQGGFLYRRAVGTATVAVTLGRHLGFDLPALNALGTGGLLLDVGKVAVPVPILAKPGALEGGEHVYVRRHVERSLELVAGHDVASRALEMIAGHHERLDGSGYPHGLRGTQIPLFARMAAVADAFDAMTLNRHYAAAMSPHAALLQLDVLRNGKFDGALVTELVHALGIYPIGTPVELADGAFGMVCGQRRGHPLQPHVIVTHDARQRTLAEPYVAAAGGAMDILRVLPPSVLRLDALRIEPALQSFHRAAA